MHNTKLLLTTLLVVAVAGCLAPDATTDSQDPPPADATPVPSTDRPPSATPSDGHTPLACGQYNLAAENAGGWNGFTVWVGIWRQSCSQKGHVQACARNDHWDREPITLYAESYINGNFLNTTTGWWGQVASGTWVCVNGPDYYPAAGSTLGGIVEGRNFQADPIGRAYAGAKF